MQAVMVCVDAFSALEKRLGVVNRTDSHLGLGCGQLQSQVAWCGIGSLRVQLRGFLLLAVELVSVRELGLNVGLRAADRLESGNGCGIVTSLTVVTCQRSLNLGIARITLLSQFEIM